MYKENMDEMLKLMDRYIENYNQTPQEAKESLIRSGVLDENGNQKPFIVNDPVKLATFFENTKDKERIRKK